MTCVCGHSRDEHQPAAMSVPLLPKAATYAIPPVSLYVGNIARSHERATYVRDECWCGCGEFLGDDHAA